MFYTGMTYFSGSWSCAWDIIIIILWLCLPFRHSDFSLAYRILPGVFACACVLCMTVFHFLILAVGHDNTPRCMCMLFMTLFRVLILTVGNDSLTS